MNGQHKAVHLRPEEAASKRIVTLRLRVQVTNPDGPGTTSLADVLVQAGGIASGWVPHVTEMPWTAGVVGG